MNGLKRQQPTDWLLSRPGVIARATHHDARTMLSPSRMRPLSWRARSKSRPAHQQKAPDMLGCFSCSFRFLFVGAARRSALTVVSRFRFRGARSAAPPLTCRKPPLPRRHTVAPTRNIIPYVGTPCRVQCPRRSYCRDALPRQIAGRKRGIIAVPHPAMLPRKKLFVRECGDEKG